MIFYLLLSSQRFSSGKVFMSAKKRIIIEAVIGAVLITGLYLFAEKPQNRIELDSGHRLIMGTFARVIAIAPSADTAAKCIDAAFEQLSTVDEMMSDYSSDSEISGINNNAYKGPVAVSEPTFEVIERAVQFSRQTDGAFDITVGPLVDLYHLAQKEANAPDKDKIAAAKSKVGFEKLKLDEQNRTVEFAVDGMRLDLGGIAKGYAIDRAIEAMQKCGANGAMVDVGGDIRVFGIPPKGKNKWQIGLQDPCETSEIPIGSGKLLMILELDNGAVATSGDYQRFVLIEGKKYSHIINTKTGSASGELSSVTIICPNATDADALATAVSVMGAEKGLALIEQRPQTEAIIISSLPEHKLQTTSGAGKYIKSGSTQN
jgi:thiamine biosynthesis lipoprotein